MAKRFVINEMLRYNNAYPYLLGLVLRTTRKIGCVKTNHRSRLAGTSGYNLKSLFSLWLNGFTAFSVKPLELGKLCNPTVAVGWTSIISVILIVGGILLLMLGLIGEYVGRIYICLNKSPQYVVREDTFTADSDPVEERQ